MGYSLVPRWTEGTTGVIGAASGGLESRISRRTVTDATFAKRRPWSNGLLVVAGYCVFFGVIGALYLVTRK
jgi:hypothetical protein